LASDVIYRVFEDSHGYLWFASRGGISRFDGYGFVNYGVRQGLPSAGVRDILERRDGSYWLATSNSGVCRYNPSSGRAQRFSCQTLGKTPDSNFAIQVYEDRSRRLWVGTGDGVFVAEAGQSAVFRPVLLASIQLQIDSITQDGAGAMWFATNGHGLYRVRTDGSKVHFPPTGAIRFVRALFTDRSGRVWCGTGRGLALLAREPTAGSSVIERSYESPRASENPATAIHQDRDGTIWFGGSSGLTRLSAGSLRTYTTANGLSQTWITAITRDLSGNLWLGTSSGGVMKASSTGFITYGGSDGVTDRVSAIVGDRANHVCTIGGIMLNLLISCEIDGSFRTIRPLFPPGLDNFGWGHDRIALQSREGEWWFATGRGVVRFPPVTDFTQLSRTAPKAVYTKSNGLAGNDVFRLFEDSRGDIWVSTTEDGGGLVRWDRRSETFDRYRGVFTPGQIPSAYAEDRDGNVWMGLYEGGLARYRDGRFTVFGERDGLPPGHIPTIHADAGGTLWAASFTSGLIRVEQPGASNPRFTRLTTADGLASDSVQSITSDAHGRLYIGTDRGLDRLNPATFEVRHYSVADGLCNSYVEVSHRDQDGQLWFGSSKGGLSRMIPQADLPEEGPRVLISAVRINGVTYPMSDSGSAVVDGLQLGPSQRRVEIDFAALHFRAGEVLRYQYKLEGADREWSAPDEQRSVNYANLASGSYRFLVRTVAQRATTQIATVTFSIARPVWQRWWFLSLMTVFCGAIVYRLHKYRLAQALEIEHVRMRIATDLHDDIGSALSQIALLSEVARRNFNANDQGLEPVTRIGELSRELTDSMSDLVWAINPRRDSLADLTHRMRRFANDLFGARDIECTFRSSSTDSDIKLSADARRQIYLIFKESVHNVVRHASCTRVSIEFGVGNSQLWLRVSDDGRGAAISDGMGGHGLSSMVQRAEVLGGTLSVDSEAGRGTTVTLTIPSPHGRGKKADTYLNRRAI
jgi:ligand-binding sensor domain-containing protein/signal transduction histidine kinase